MDNEKLIMDNVPKLRFPKFKEPWVEVKLGDIASFSKGKGISKADIAEDGAIECIRYGELYTIYGETIDVVKSRTNIDVNDFVLSEANDVIIPASGETQIDIATASCVLRAGIALGGDLNIIKSKINGVFLSFYLNSCKKNEIANLAQGISVVHLYSSQLRGLTINYPLSIINSSTEQTKIATFLTAVDEKLNALKKKKAHLELYKKGVMQKLFPSTGSGQLPALRFKITNEKGELVEPPDWEVKRLGEVLIIGSGKDYKHLQIGNIPVYGTGGLMTHVNSFLYDGPTVCIGRKGTIDSPMFHEGKIWTVDTLFFTHSFKKCIPKYIFYVFQTINWKEYNEASGVPSLSKSTIEKINISIPSIQEQTKIANFLSAIDEKINHTQSQIEKTEVWKKGLLQKMFV